MRLYGHPMSSNSRRVIATAAHLGIDLELRLIDLGNAEDRAVLREVNPNDKVPALVDGDFVLWESHAIMQYLCEQVPGQTLYPDATGASERRARADVNRWLYWVSSHLAPAVGPINFERMWKRFTIGGPPDEALIARYERFFHHAAGVLDAHLAGRTWIAGDRLTLADFSVGATMMYMRPTQLPVDGYPNVVAHVARVHALEAWRSTEPARVG